MRILTDNIIANNTSISMTNRDPDYDIDNLYSNMLEEIVQSTGSTSTITVNYDSDQTVDSIFFGYHNLNSLVVNFRDVGDSLIDTYTFNFPEQMVRQYISTALTGIRKIEIIITAGTIVFLGNFSCGSYTQLYKVQTPINIDYNITGKFEQTHGGQFLNRLGRRLGNMDINLRKNTDEQHDAFFDAFDEVMLGKTFWLDRNEDLSTRQPMFGAFTQQPSTSENNEFIDITTSFSEGR
jgi:hypothetical protein